MTWLGNEDLRSGRGTGDKHKGGDVLMSRAQICVFPARYKDLSFRTLPLSVKENTNSDKFKFNNRKRRKHGQKKEA